MVAMVPILDMGYYTAKSLGILHLHFLHILHILLAYRYHRVCLCQADKRCVIEHSSNDGGSFNQPMLLAYIQISIYFTSTHQTSGNSDFEVC